MTAITARLVVILAAGLAANHEACVLRAVLGAWG